MIPSTISHAEEKHQHTRNGNNLFTHPNPTCAIYIILDSFSVVIYCYYIIQFSKKTIQYWHNSTLLLVYTVQNEPGHSIFYKIACASSEDSDQPTHPQQFKQNHCPSVLIKRLATNIGTKHGFSCINIRKVPWEVLKTVAEGRGFQHLPRDLANVNALKNHVRSLLLHKKLKTFATFRVISCTILFRLFTDVSRT